MIARENHSKSTPWGRRNP